MDELETIKIKSADDYTIINAADFDPDIHELYDAPEAKQPRKPRKPKTDAD